MAKDQVPQQKPKKVPVQPRVAQTEKLGFFDRVKNFIKGVRSELRKVTWPTKKELINYTTIVIVLTVILATVIGLFDLFWKQLFFNWL